MPCLSSISDRGHNKLQSYNDYPLPQGTVAHTNIEYALAKIYDKAAAEGEDPTAYPVVVDTNSSKPAVMTTYATTLTRAQRKYW